MTVTLDPTLKIAQDGDSHRIIAEIKNTGGQSIPFDGYFLTAETTDETNPNVITHSTGRICSISVFGTDKLQYIYSDAERRTFETTVTLDDTTDLGLGGAVTITDCSIVELADATIGLVFVCYDATNYYLRQTVLSITGTVSGNALIATYAKSSYPEIRSPYCILMASGDYLLVYIIEDTTPDWNINKRTCNDFSTWSAEAAITPAGTDTAEKYNCSLCQIDTDDVFLLFDWTDATDITNCYYSISADDGATWGSAVAITSYDTTSKIARHPIAAQQATTEMHIVYNEQISPLAAFDVYDTTAVDANSKGFLGAVYDGRYVYFIPYHNGAFFGQVTQYDTQGAFDAAGSYAVFDTTTINANSKGFSGAVYDGSRYVYFITYDGGASGIVTRYDTQGDFTAAASWEVYDTTAVDADSKGFGGAVYDGRYIYFVPLYNGSNFGQVTRYDTQGAFDAAGSYAVFDTTTINANSKGFFGAVYDDSRYIYFVPYSDASGLVTRYDTEGDFTTAASWKVFDTALVNSNSKGFQRGVFDSRYIYFVPFDNGSRHGQVTRYDTQGAFDAVSSWEVYDTTAVDADSKGFSGAVYDGSRYIFFVPYDNGSAFGQITQYDTWGSFTAAASWEAYDTTAVDADSKGFGGAVYDNSQYIYFAPYNNGAVFGQITRYDAQQDFATETTSLYKINNWSGAAWALSAGLPSYSVYDITAVDADAKGYNGCCSDGSRYIYFAPHNNGAAHGHIARYDTQGDFSTAASWTVYDITAVDADAKGFHGCCFDGSRYIYFAPYNNGTYHGHIARYDTQGDFSTAASWTVYDITAVDADAKGYEGCCYDGSRYIFFAPYNNGAAHGHVARYDTQGDFSTAASWTVYDITAVDADAKSYNGCCSDGSRYIYFAPHNNGVYHGHVARYDTQGDFSTAASWTVYDITAVDADAKGYIGCCFDGSRYIYFAPYYSDAYNGHVARYDTQGDFSTAASWTVYDITAVDADAKSYSGCCYDGSRYIFFAPYINDAAHGHIARYDTQGGFSTATSWTVYDITAVDADAKGFHGCCFDGSRYIFFAPLNNGAVHGHIARYDTQGDFAGEAPKFITGDDNSDTVICLEPTSNDFYVFWEKTISGAISVKWDKEFTSFDLSSYIATDRDIIIERTIDNKPARLSFTLVNAHYFDESNVFAMLKPYTEKGSIVTLRLGETVAASDYWQNQGTFHIKNRSLSYKKGVMPLINVVCEDSSSPLADMELITTRQYNGVFPETIIAAILNQKGAIDYSNISISTMDDRTPLYCSWTNTKILDLIGAICDRFGYFLRCDVDNSFDVKKITEDASTDHTYTDRSDILEFIPDNDFSDYVNRIIVQSEERLFSQVTYPEKEIQITHGTLGWWQGNEEIKIPYADDYSLQCSNAYPIVKNLKANFLFKDKLNWTWTPDASNTSGTLKLEAPLLIIKLAGLITATLALGKIPIVGNFINATGLLEIFKILCSVTNWQATIMAQPIGYVKASVEGIYDDEDFQTKIGRTVKRTIVEPLAYTDAQCAAVSEHEMMITRLQRSRATIKKIGHLQDEEGDTIQVIHPISQANVKLYVTNITRRVRIPSKSDTSSGMFDTLEGWQII